MEEKTLENISDLIVLAENTRSSSTCDTDQSQENISDGILLNENSNSSSSSAIDQLEANTNTKDDNNVRSEMQELLSNQEQNHPILQKIADLRTKIQNLKNEHKIILEEVQGISSNPFPSEVLNAIQALSAEHELLKKKYVEECIERKRLYNEVIELKGNIRVFCRCRPLNQDESENGSSVVEFDPSHENELHIICSDSSKKQFKFDHVFRPYDNQESVFAQTSPIVTSVLDGYNVCIFAYGQTGTGKTFTMEGTPGNRGVNYRTLEELFRISEERTNSMRYELFVSMLEVYNEKIRDLLVEKSSEPAKKLEIKQSAEGTQEVPGLVEARVYGTDEVWELLKTGSQIRSVGSTNANELSSRSHCLLRVTVKGENLVNGQRTRSHLWLVDLAGSERLGRIEAEGERLKESQFINKSLSALGDVISALASKTTHVPYRNSKLTHMLQSSLGGDCKTLMFVQISPSSADLGETLCSLNFASRVRGIEYGPARKQADLTELLKYKQLAEKSKHDEKETKKLQEGMQALQLKLSAKEHVCRSLQEKVRDLENQLSEEKKSRLKQENRALGTACTATSSRFISQNQTQKTIVMGEKKPPLGPTKLRLPLRRITNFLPPRSPIPHHNKTLTSSTTDKENAYNGNSNALMRPRRASIAFRPPPPPQASSSSTMHNFQPKRRVSIATLHRPELPSSSTTMTPKHYMSATRSKIDSVMGRPSFARDPRRIRRISRVFSPLPERRAVALSGPMEEATPIGTGSSKFMGSPLTHQAGSWKPKHPTVIALQRKKLVWSPLKWKNSRRSLPPPS